MKNTNALKSNGKADRQGDRAESSLSETMEITWPPRFVRMIKVGEALNPYAPASAPKEYRYGVAANEGSLPIWYAVEGWLLQLPLPGRAVRVLRVVRNGLTVPGIFVSSHVITIPRPNEFTTLNSVYRWEEIGSSS